jgi:uncharacterized protein
MTPPRTIQQGPYRVEDDTWLEVPTTVSGRARPGHQPEAEPFWGGLRESRLMLQRCVDCRRYTHFPVAGCEWCGGDVVVEEVDGTATVNTFSVCYRPFGYGMESPYVVAIVNPEVEPALQLMTDIVGCRISDVRLGMRVRPVFVIDDEAALVFYEPVGADADGTSAEQTS